MWSVMVGRILTKELGKKDKNKKDDDLQRIWIIIANLNCLSIKI